MAPTISLLSGITHSDHCPLGERKKPGEVVEAVLVQIFESRQTGPISTSPYAAITASHTCRIMVPRPVISDVSNCPFLILFADSIPLNVTFAFPNLLNPSI